MYIYLQITMYMETVFCTFEENKYSVNQAVDGSEGNTNTNTNRWR